MGERRDELPRSETAFGGLYEAIEELGTGSFGRVYRGVQLSTGQRVAIKVLHLDALAPAERENRIARFRREMQLCGALSHPHVVRLIDSGQTDDEKPYAVFEYVPGKTLKEVLEAEGRLAEGECVRLMAQLLDALSCAHAQGVVHRDLKPENIMVTKTGVWRNAMVLDFGLGGFTQTSSWQAPRLTATREMMGTPCYAAPEQLRGETPTARSDLYSWGLILLECLTGQLAVGGGSAQEVVLKQLGPEPIEIPQWLRERALGRLLSVVTAKRVEKRAATALDLLEALSESAQPLEPRARTGGSAERERRQVTVGCCRLMITAKDGTPLDVEEVDHLLQAQRELVARVASSSGGVIVSTFANRVLFAFGYPQAREDDARRAARMGLEVVRDVATAKADAASRARVEAAIGVHTGLVVVHDQKRLGGAQLRELTGLVPQISNQLAELAAAGEVVVSRDTQHLLRDEIAAEAAGECVVPELSDKLSYFRLSRGVVGDAMKGIHRSAETPLVGRAAQLEQLWSSRSEAEARRPRVLLLSGEAGIGKSRLLREMRRRLPAKAWIECRCAQESESAALHPIIDLLQASDASIEALLTRYGFDLAHNVPILASLLSQPHDPRFPGLRLSAERMKELTLQLVVELLFKMAQDQPTVFAVENLHWADPTTIELVARLIEEVSAARHLQSATPPKLCILLTTRPEFAPPWSTEEVSLVPLPRLGADEVRELIAGHLRLTQPPRDTLVREVLQRAEGVPLFVEEIARLLNDRAAAGVEEGGRASRAVPIPPTLRDLLMARLDAVSSTAREMAQVASVLGRDFRYELLRAVSGRKEVLLRDDVAELVRAGLLYQSRGLRGESYVFRHALIRDAAYDAITRSTRQTLHAAVAAALQEQFADVARQRPELVAQHLESGGLIEEALDFWSQAGSRNYGRAAYAEAQRQLEHALGLVARLAPSAARSRREVNLLVTLGTMVGATRGWNDPEGERLFNRATALCKELDGDIAPGVLYGLWGTEVTRSDPARVAELIPHMRALSEKIDQPLLAHMGHASLAAAAFWQGDLPTANRHFLCARESYGTPTRRLAYDGRVYSYAMGAWVTWALGFGDQAAALRQQGWQLAQATSDPYSMSAVVSFGSMLLLDMGDLALGLEWADVLGKLADEQRLPFWKAPSLCLRGLAFSRQGRTEEGLSLLRDGIEAYRRVGPMASYSYFHPYLAEGYLAAGRVDEALSTVATALALCRKVLSRFHEPESLRIRGEALARRGELREAQASLRQSIDLARKFSARGYVLRSSLALARLLAGTPRADEARAEVRKIYAEFSEGFGAPEMKKAAALAGAVPGEARP